MKASARRTPGDINASEAHHAGRKGEPEAGQAGVVPGRREERNHRPAVEAHCFGKGVAFVEVEAPGNLVEEGEARGQREGDQGREQHGLASRPGGPQTHVGRGARVPASAGEQQQRHARQPEPALGAENGGRVGHVGAYRARRQQRGDDDAAQPQEQDATPGDAAPVRRAKRGGERRAVGRRAPGEHAERHRQQQRERAPRAPRFVKEQPLAHESQRQGRAAEPRAPQRVAGRRLGCGERGGRRGRRLWLAPRAARPTLQGSGPAATLA